MYLQFLGTGDAFTQRLGHNSAIFKFNNTNLMIDCPDSNYERILKLNMKYDDINNVFISHLHADHINGLEKLAYYRKYATPNLPKPKIFIAEDLINDLWRTLQSGLGYDANDRENTIEDYFDVNLVKDTFTIDNVSFRIVRTVHKQRMISYGLIAENLFYFSCDSKVDANLLKEIAETVKYIFHDCHLFDFPIASHASLDEIKQLPTEIKDKVVLMHYNDNYVDKKKRKELEKRENLIIAKFKKKYKFKTIFNFHSK